jgi:hypothetical protein
MHAFQQVIQHPAKIFFKRPEEVVAEQADGCVEVAILFEKCGWRKFVARI